MSRPPLEVRKQERSQILQGKCHKCHKWVAVEGVKVGEVKVGEDTRNFNLVAILLIMSIGKVRELFW